MFFETLNPGCHSYIRDRTLQCYISASDALYPLSFRSAFTFLPKLSSSTTISLLACSFWNFMNAKFINYYLWNIAQEFCSFKHFCQNYFICYYIANENRYLNTRISLFNRFFWKIDSGKVSSVKKHSLKVFWEIWHSVKLIWGNDREFWNWYRRWGS